MRKRQVGFCVLAMSAAALVVASTAAMVSEAGEALGETEQGTTFSSTAESEATTTNAPRRRRRRRPKPYKAAEFSDGGTITGLVLYKGPKPPNTKIAIVKDHDTCGRRETVVPKIRVDEKGRVAEAVVFLTDITRGKAFAKRDKPPVIDQHLCTFVPHVQAVRVGEPVEIINSDDVAHNINVTQRIYTLFNILQPLKNMKAEKRFTRPGVVKLRCNVHDWMNGYVYVFNNPYHQVTAADGAFRLENVPAGEYELAVWQEHLKEQYFKVKVKAGETTNLSVELAPAAGR